MANRNPYVGISDEMRKEIQRQAELQLAAQLQSGIGADARALSFVSLMAAATVVVGGGAVAFLTATPPDHGLGYACAGIVAGFIIAMGCAAMSARPRGFDYAGSWPSDWEDEIANNAQFPTSCAEQLEDFDERIRRNNKVLRSNAKWMTAALLFAVITLVIGCGSSGYMIWQR